MDQIKHDRNFIYYDTCTPLSYRFWTSKLYKPTISSYIDDSPSAADGRILVE
jgi:hypothetical protein